MSWNTASNTAWLYTTPITPAVLNRWESNMLWMKDRVRFGDAESQDLRIGKTASIATGEITGTVPVNGAHEAPGFGSTVGEMGTEIRLAPSVGILTGAVHRLEPDLSPGNIRYGTTIQLRRTPDGSGLYNITGAFRTRLVTGTNLTVCSLPTVRTVNNQPTLTTVKSVKMRAGGTVRISYTLELIGATGSGSGGVRLLGGGISSQLLTGVTPGAAKVVTHANVPVEYDTEISFQLASNGAYDVRMSNVAIQIAYPLSTHTVVMS